MTDAQIKSLVKDIIKQELKDVNKSIKDIEKEHKKLVDEEGVRNIVRKMLINQYKWFWQKSNVFINNL